VEGSQSVSKKPKSFAVEKDVDRGKRGGVNGKGTKRQKNDAEEKKRTTQIPSDKSQNCQDDKRGKRASSSRGMEPLRGGKTRSKEEQMVHPRVGGS